MTKMLDGYYIPASIVRELLSKQITENSTDEQKRVLTEISESILRHEVFISGAKHGQR